MRDILGTIVRTGITVGILAAFTYMGGCIVYNLNDRTIHYRVTGFGVKESGEGTRKQIKFEQYLEGDYYLGSQNLKRFSYKYGPVTISYSDFKDVEELSGQLEANLTRAKSLLEIGIDPELALPDPLFRIPYEVEGLKRLNPDTLYLLAASGSIRLMEDVSLGDIMCMFSTLKAVETSDISDEIDTRLSFWTKIFPDLTPRYIPDGVFDKFEKYKHAGYIFEDPLMDLMLEGERHFKDVASEMFYLISEIEGIEGVVQHIEGYNLPVDYFSIKRIENFGIGTTQDMGLTASSQAGLFGIRSNADGESQNDFAYRIHLTGMLAVTNSRITF